VLLEQLPERLLIAFSSPWLCFSPETRAFIDDGQERATRPGHAKELEPRKPKIDLGRLPFPELSLRWGVVHKFSPLVPLRLQLGICLPSPVHLLLSRSAAVKVANASSLKKKGPAAGILPGLQAMWCWN
jgi:hypothetical protein